MSERLTAEERAIVAREVTGRDFKVISDDTEVPIVICFEGKGRSDGAVWWPSLNPDSIEADKRRLQAFACVEWLITKIYIMNHDHKEDFGEYLNSIGWAIRRRRAHDLQRLVLKLEGQKK
jgi:hypothetical protein